MRRPAWLILSAVHLAFLVVASTAVAGEARTAVAADALSRVESSRGDMPRIALNQHRPTPRTFTDEQELPCDPFTDPLQCSMYTAGACNCKRNCISGSYG